MLEVKRGWVSGATANGPRSVIVVLKEGGAWMEVAGGRLESIWGRAVRFPELSSWSLAP